MIRRAIEGLAIPNVKSKISDYLTVSVGGYAKVPTKQDTMDTYMKEADARLYRAKDAGRNIVVAN